MKNIVDTKNNIDYTIQTDYIQSLKKEYPFLKVVTMAKSIEGRDIYCITLGNGPKNILYVGTHHGLEGITTLVLLKLIEEMCYSYKSSYPMCSLKMKDYFKKVSLYVVPMLNPDGVERASYDNVWQANARGVDLNHNYDAGYELCKQAEIDEGIVEEGPTKFGGERAESEPETIALCNLCRSIEFAGAIALHTQGEEIYYDYNNLASSKDKSIAQIMGYYTGYKVLSQCENASHGGFKDWFVNEFNRSAITMELGYGKNPLPITDFDDIYLKVRKALVMYPVLV